MRHGLLVKLDGTCHGWTWADDSTIFPGEFPVAPGDRLIDLSRHTNAEAQQVIRVCAQATPTDRDALLAGYPQVVLTDVPTPPAGHDVVCQPGYRRLAHRPTMEWQDQEVVARMRANARLALGESIQTVVDEEFGHVPPATRRARMGQATPTADGPARFSLPSLVTLSTQQTMQGLVTVRTFPYHVPVGEY